MCFLIYSLFPIYIAYIGCFLFSVFSIQNRDLFMSCPDLQLYIQEKHSFLYRDISYIYTIQGFFLLYFAQIFYRKYCPFFFCFPQSYIGKLYILPYKNMCFTIYRIKTLFLIYFVLYIQDSYLFCLYYQYFSYIKNEHPFFLQLSPEIFLYQRVFLYIYTSCTLLRFPIYKIDTLFFYIFLGFYLTFFFRFARLIFLQYFSYIKETMLLLYIAIFFFVFYSENVYSLYVFSAIYNRYSFFFILCPD